MGKLKKANRAVNYDLPLHRCFEFQAESHPEHVALVYGSLRINYRKLNERANQMAHRLRGMGIGPDKLVGISLNRGIELIVAILGVLKAGGAYVSLDPDYPRDRLVWMLEDCAPTVLITEQALLATHPHGDAQVLCADLDTELDSQSISNPQPCVGLENLAYIIYTSGSTGKPKGCLTQHGNVMRLWAQSQEIYAFNDQDVWTLFHSYTFDFSVWEIWGPLLHGGTLVIVPFITSRSPDEFYKLLVDERVTVLNQTPSAFFQLMQIDTEQSENLLSLRYIILGGEALNFNALKPWIARHGLENPVIINGYGPTETTIFATFKTILAEDLERPGISNLGTCIKDLSLQIVDNKLNPVTAGESGEILIGGPGVARGYLNRPELTAKRFIQNPFSDDADYRFYRTGDMARFLPDGQIEYLGRIDNQVKIRGFRIELGEIECVLRAHPAIREAAASVREDEPGNSYLAAYIVAETGHEYKQADIMKYLAASLPDYMVPVTLTAIDSLPLSPNGKLDRNALPLPSQNRPDVEQPYVAPRTATERTLAKLWCMLLKIDRAGIDDNFFELGGNSLLSVQLVERLKNEHALVLPLVKFFEYPKICQLAAYLDSNMTQASNQVITAKEIDIDEDDRDAQKVAIIGMAGRYPGADNVTELWNNLCNGIESTSFFTDAQLDISVSIELRNNPGYVMARGVISGIDQFDAAFFGINPYEAEIMDPQHRLFLEMSWNALENAGYAPDSPAAQQAGWIAVYGGVYNNTYYSQNVITRPDLIKRAGDFQTMTATEKDYVAMRVSNKLNLKGPSVTVHTACSTSLVAISQAWHALVSQQCDLALAGGASITVPQNTGHIYAEGCMLSKDGHTRPFDSNAQGTVFSDGVGVVVLKRLKDAKRDADTIYAVILGVAMNNDGGNKMSFSAPSIEGQASVISKAQALAGVNPESISYVEAHGTATPVGDPVEVEALTQAFRAGTYKKQYCVLGSIKSNFGHTTIAAGVAGIIKTSLALKHEQLPPTVNYEHPNPKIDFSNTPFVVRNKLTAWPKGDTPRRAGVSSFGVGGTNAHVVLEEAPNQPLSGPSRTKKLLMLSAKSQQALDTMTDNLSAYLKINPEANLADIAFTLQTGRKNLPFRRWILCDTVANAIQNLDKLDQGSSATRMTELRQPEVIFMFPGQSSQYVNMGLHLYQHEEIFRQVVDTCAEYFMAHLNRDLRQILYPDSDRTAEACALLKETWITQPALFTIEYGLYCLWKSWGVHPAAMIGHSVGEIVAATVAGVFLLEDACKIVANRGRMMHGLPGGSMLSVRLSAEETRVHLTPELEIASYNAPHLCVVSGPDAAIDKLQAEFAAKSVMSTRLQTSHAFHSAMMDLIVDDFAKLVESVSLSTPQIPFISTVTGTWITDKQATDPVYWARHLREPVQFGAGINTIWQQPERVLLEAGPGTVLTTLARQSATDIKKQIALASLPAATEDQAELATIQKTIGKLWQTGVLLDWTSFYAHENRLRLPLPTYPFDKKTYWINAVRSAETNETSAPIVPIQSDINTGVVMSNRKASLVSRLKDIFENTTGIEMSEFSNDTTFFEMGMDSLLLTQVVTELVGAFKVQVTFRQLLEEYGDLDKLSEYLDSQLPKEFMASPAPVAATVNTPAPMATAQPVMTASPAVSANTTMSSDVQNLVFQQIQLMNRQLELLQGRPMQASATATQSVLNQPVAPPAIVSAQAEEPPPPKTFGAMARVATHKSDKQVNAVQEAALQELITNYCKKTALSKKMAQDNRDVLADPRIVSGFRPEVKELTYQIHTVKSSGAKLWDVDGNEYVDMSCGFGTNFFGNVPEFIKNAIKEQLDKGMEIGPSIPLAGEVARLICDMIHADRAAFCSTGSEAVLAAMRLARTVSGKKIIVSFTNDYHGLFDEVLVRGNKKLRTTPAAPGIMASCVENILVLDYGTPESLNIIRERADDIAGILVEPVQSRDPDLQPAEYLREMRKLTEERNICLIFDEVITGFRVAQGGCQEYFGISADLGTYGKVIGGGLPMGVVAGKKKWMDALDGGQWQFGDNSTPVVGMTYFAGTYVRHPLALAAAKAVLEYLNINPNIQQELADKTSKLANELNDWCQQVSAPIHIAHFSSMYRINYTAEFPYGDLLYVYMRERGVHVWENRPCFMTTAHSAMDIALIINAFKESVMAMQAHGFISGNLISGTTDSNNKAVLPSLAPSSGARQGRDPSGKPAWYVADLNHPGKFIMVGAPE